MYKAFVHILKSVFWWGEVEIIIIISIFIFQKLWSGEWNDAPGVLQFSLGTQRTNILIWNYKFLVLCSFHCIVFSLPTTTQRQTLISMQTQCTQTLIQVKSRMSNLFQNKSKSYLYYSVLSQKETIAWKICDNRSVRDYFIPKIEPIMLSSALPKKKLPISEHAHNSDYQEKPWR